MPKADSYLTPTYYSPDQSLIDYMHDLLQIKYNKRNLDADEQAREKSRLRTAKSRHILPKIVFPAMANLTFFFDAISQFPELQETFESDIKELLGIRRLNPRAYTYGFMFMDLVKGILALNNTAEDFRLKLIRILEDLIWFKLHSGLKIVESESAKSIVFQDIERAIAWIQMLASRVKDEYDLTKLSPRYGDYSKMTKEQTKIEMERIDYQTLEDFETYAKQNSPTRTFDFDTKKLIEG